MTCICEDDDWKAAERSYSALPSNDPDRSSILHCIPLYEVRQDQYNEVPNRYQCNDARILQ